MNVTIPISMCLIFCSSIQGKSIAGEQEQTSSASVALNSLLKDYKKLTANDLTNSFRSHCKSILDRYATFRQAQKDMIYTLVALPPEDYLSVWESIADNLDPGNPSHLLALNDFFHDPVYGYTRSFFALNWRQQSIRGICEKLKAKLNNNPQWNEVFQDVLQGETYKETLRNGLEDMAGKLPSYPLPLEGYAPQFKKWTGDEAAQKKLILELAEAFPQFTAQIWKTTKPEDLDNLYDLGLDTLQIAEELFEMQPPATEEARKRLGKLYYEKVYLAGFKKGLEPPPEIKEPELFYRQFLLWVENHPKMKLIMQQMPKTMTTSTSYLLEETLYLNRAPRKDCPRD